MNYRNFPFTLAHPLEQYEAQKAAGIYSKAMNYALDFFEISTQYLSMLLLGLIREHYDPQTPNDHVNFVVGKIDAKRPLSFGDWANDILPRTAHAARELIPDEPLTEKRKERAEALKFFGTLTYNPLYEKQTTPPGLQEDWDRSKE